MQKKNEIAEITDITEETIVAYFDLEFCNDMVSRHNFPVSIGVSYRNGNREIGSYFSFIRFGEEVQLWEEQLERIGYRKEQLEELGVDMNKAAEELAEAHGRYQPQAYISFGKQDEELLKRYTEDVFTDWKFYDALNFLRERLNLKYDISLEKYAYICECAFVHQFQPLEDARALAKIVWCVLQEKENKERCREVAEEYDRKMFIIRYQDRKRAYHYLAKLPVLSPKQKEKLKNHKNFLRENRKQYMDYNVDVREKEP